MGDRFVWRGDVGPGSSDGESSAVRLRRDQEQRDADRLREQSKADVAVLRIDERGEDPDLVACAAKGVRSVPKVT